MRICITGAAGFIGHHLTRACLAAGDEIVALDNLRRGDRAAVPVEAHWIEGDIREPDTLAKAFAGVRRVYHLAAQSNVLGAVSDVDYSFTTNVIGTYNVLRAANEAGVERVVFASSREVYGEVDAIPVSESHPFAPKNAYGASKVAGELYCRVFQDASGPDISVLRLANVYGAGDVGRVIPTFLARAHAGLDLELFGGDQMLDFIPVSLVVRALRRAAAQSLGGQAINVGSGVATTLRALAERVCSLPGASVNVRILPGRPAEVTRFVADTTLMRHKLDLTPSSDPLDELDAMW